MPTSLPRKTGVYSIINKVNGKVYIGSGGSKSGMRGREASHLGELKRGTHCNYHLQRAWDKYGSQNFEFEVIECCDSDECLAKEQLWLDFYRAYDPDYGYNIYPKAGKGLGRVKGYSISDKARAAINWTGRRHTPEAKAKMAAYARNRPPEVIARMSAAGKRKKLSEEHKRKIGLASKGKPRSPETVAKMTGQKRTALTKARISAGVRLAAIRRRIRGANRS